MCKVEKLDNKEFTSIKQGESYTSILQQCTDELCAKTFVPEEAFVPWLSVCCVSC